MKALRLPALVVLAAALGGFAFARLYLPPASSSPQLAVEQRLLCPQCQEVRLDVCDRPICADMKADIARRLAGGQSPDAVVAAYRDAYGPSILADNQPGGPAALLPWALLAAALLALLALAWRHRGTEPAPPPASAGRELEAELAAWRSGR